ncbi:MAG: SEL1-like repeat protein [Anaerolineaceae bacterium]|nr:SEL1-like repeat protein [Oscillospiraceae bacterium]MBQ6479796.1 SEL1-like repeat protein [Anaerolineaceae bacterium]
MKRSISFLLVLCLLILFPVGALAEKTPFYEDSKAITRAAESVLMLTCYDNNGNAVSTGSGFLAFEDGIIVTNFHVVNGQIGAIKANTEDGMYFDINEILCFDQTADVAILKTNAKTRLDLLTLASSSSLEKGSRVVAIGSPLGLLNIVSEGIYSGIVFDETEYILFTAAISSGSSGGALFNESGEVIGVTATTYTEGQNLNLAVPIENVNKLWDLYQSGEYVATISADERVPTSTTGGGEEAYITAEQCFDEGKYSEAVKWYAQAAEQGHAEAQYKLGSCYYLGLGIDQNTTKAEEWISKSVQQGFFEAECLLGYFYYGQVQFSTTYNSTRPVNIQIHLPEWFVNAISISYPIKYEEIRFEDGTTGGQISGGKWYTGYGVEKDRFKATELFRSAADNNYSIAEYNLGICYETGQGVKEDELSAFEWYLRAAEKEYEAAENKIGFCYATGTGVTEDHEKAIECFSLSADHYGEDTREYIGTCLYEIGSFYEINTKDYMKAIQWYQKSMQYGNDRAQRAYRRLNGW